VFVLVIGNLGTIKMIVQGFPKIAASDVEIQTGSFFQRIGFFFDGVKLFLQGKSFTYYPGDWYWIPSRTIPGEPITEFPYFTFLYGDPHAHMFAYPITVLVLCWIMAILKNRMTYRKAWHGILQVICGALFIGTLKPTNTWDYPVFLFVAVLVLAYVLARYGKVPSKFFGYFPEAVRKVLWILCVEGIFVAASYLFYYPFTAHYGQAYSSVDILDGDRTPISSYLTHWGFFLFIIYSFAIWEIREWMAATRALRAQTVLRATPVHHAALCIAGGSGYPAPDHPRAGDSCDRACGSAAALVIVPQGLCGRNSSGHPAYPGRVGLEPDGGVDRFARRHWTHEHGVQILLASLDFPVPELGLLPDQTASRGS
jgi:hypothetical protein